ncbi:MAG: peptidoglycan-binding protein [Candidatus Sungbacteria bacterium]|nr:peptidoglycan-binding protein [Candidatus Sungbacteria bacterium]
MRTLSGIFAGLMLVSLPFVASAGTVLSRNLHFGMYRNPDVILLQNFLRSQGYLSLPATGNYLNGTIQAVKKFQQAHGIAPIGGYFGPQSRRVANEIIAAQQAMPTGRQDGAGSAGVTGGVLSSPFVGGLATTSPYKGKIFFDWVQSGGEVQDERMSVTNRTDIETILVSGFSITTEHGQNYVVPLGFGLPGFSAAPLDPIVLRPHERVIISVGRQSKNMNFRENMCTGYFDETAQFSPGLSHRCPATDTRTLHNLSDQCVRVISGIGGCRTGPLPEFVDPTRPECMEYIAQNFNYAGCVANYKSRPDFYNDQWLVWMQRTVPFFNKRFETVTLKDREGRVVDEYKYNNY